MIMDTVTIESKDKNVLKMILEDYPSEMTFCIYQEDFERELSERVDDGTLREWFVDKVQELLKNKYQLGDLPITTSEFEKTNAILEEMR